jgi:hypothetical protein
MKILFGAAAFMLVNSAAFAQPSPKASHMHAVQLVRLPNGDYTHPQHVLDAWGESAKVTFHPEGPKTLVTVTVSASSKKTHQFNLKSGTDCVHMNSVVPLGPAIPGQPSQTLVSLPINMNSKNYAIEMQDTTAKQQFQEVCAQHG